MPTLRLSTTEAATLKRKRARDKAWNIAIMAAVARVKARLKGADALQAATVHMVLADLRKLVR